MNSCRLYGHPPYTVAVLHGGPGAAGEMAPVARELAGEYGIIEPLQTACCVDGQIDELAHQLTAHAQIPAVIIGFSWGAWLACLLAARYTQLVRSVILISSGAFESRYAQGIMQTRLSRLTPSQCDEVTALIDKLNDQQCPNKNDLMVRFGHLMSIADAFEHIEHEPEQVQCSYQIFSSVWNEAAHLRESGELLNRARKITCPVAAIHGDYDPTPFAGITKPLRVLPSLETILLPRCGHTPWYEKHARNSFYCVLRRLIGKHVSPETI